jgi:hypothetical protein
VELDGRLGEGVSLAAFARLQRMDPSFAQDMNGANDAQIERSIGTNLDGEVSQFSARHPSPLGS